MALILVADDELLYRRLVEANLVKEGYQVVCAINGEDALEKFSAQTPDLAILDILMPRLDGITVCERIRQFSSVPVIMLTARSDEQDRVKGLNIGADDYVTKPCGLYCAVLRKMKAWPAVILPTATCASTLRAPRLPRTPKPFSSPPPNTAC
jgi:DNA-binding response OmpR family regulator